MRQAISELVNGSPPSGNWGLAHQAYLTGHSNNHAEQRALFAVIANSAWPLAYQSLYWTAWTEALNNLNAQTNDLKTTSPLALGLGEQNVHEVGLTLHRTYGVPFVPASSIKGLLRRSVADWLGIREDLARLQGEKEIYQPDKKRADLLRELGFDESDPKRTKVERWIALFGTTDGAGLIQFLDAMPVPGGANPLMVDTVTVHHQEYYHGNQPKPTDMDSPNPVSMLAVKPGVVFRFAFCVPPGRQTWAAKIREILVWALQHEGIGGKTNAGYGRFAPADESGGNQPSQATHARSTGAPGATIRAKVQRKTSDGIVVRLENRDELTCQLPEDTLSQLDKGDSVEVERVDRRCRFIRKVNG